jgi:hypothetical protein
MQAGETVAVSTMAFVRASNFVLAPDH